MSNTVSYVKLLVSAEKIPTMAEGRIGKYTDRKMCDDRSRALQMGPCCIWSESPNDQKLIELSCKSTDISVASVFMLSCPIVLWRNYFVLFNHSLTTWKGFWWLFAFIPVFQKRFPKVSKMTSQTQTLLSADHWQMFTCTAKKKNQNQWVTVQECHKSFNCFIIISVHCGANCTDTNRYYIRPWCRHSIWVSSLVSLSFTSSMKQEKTLLSLLGF